MQHANAPLTPNGRRRLVALVEEEDFETAKRLGLEFGEDFRLLQDLGWHPTDSRQTVALTTPPHDLMELPNQDESERVFAESRTERESAEADGDPPTRKALLQSTVDEIRGRQPGGDLPVLLFACGSATIRVSAPGWISNQRPAA